MKITRLDRRHNCHGIMQYMVQVDYDTPGRDNRIELFKAWRSWCWEVFGPGAETKWIVVRPQDAGPNGECRMVSTTQWAWHTEYDEMRLYFRDDATLSSFLFQWS